MLICTAFAEWTACHAHRSPPLHACERSRYGDFIPYSVRNS